MTSLPTTVTVSPRAARRVQYRVGHGGFHATFVNPTGAISDRLTYVYDVGAKPDKKELLCAIKSFVGDLSTNKTHQVDYIFLSHIDEDHVNGLRELLDALNSHKPKIAVKNVVLPWLSPIQKLLTQTGNNHRQPGTVVTSLASSDADADSFLEQLGAERVIRVTAEGEDGAPPTTISRTHPGGNAITPPCRAGWVLLPIKTPTPHGFDALFLAELANLLKNTGLDPNDTDDHQEILAFHRSSVRTAVNRAAPQVGVAQKHVANWSSLALLHGASTSAQTCVFAQSQSHADIQCEHGWLHTGDLPLKDTKVWRNLSSELARASLTSPLCAVVAPHHGSTHNHEDALYVTTKPGAVILTTGTKLSGGSVGAPSYSYNLGDVLTTARRVGAMTIEMNN